MRVHYLFLAGAAVAGTLASCAATDDAIAIDTPMTPPAWAVAQRALMDANAEGARVYADLFLDERGHLPVTPEWGVAEGPDDLMEHLRNWPLAHAVGGPDALVDLWEKAWEGHLDQFTQATIPELEFARDGIYHKEFITSFDWEHTSEGLGPFYFYGLSRPTNDRHVERTRRFAGFYLNEDPEAPNYDAQRRIIRSLFNGSRGPKLTPATPDDWDGPAAPGVDPQSPRRTRFLTSGNIRGDHPLNLGAVNLVFHAYLLTQDAKYRDWVLEYVDAWLERIDANGGNIPSNIGLDGSIGGEWDGKWYGGVFGWDSPDGGQRNYVFRGPPEAFSAALLLTGDHAYAQVLRRQIDNLYAAQRVENGKVLLPRYHGDQGWYGYHPVSEGPSGALGNIPNILLDLYLWSLSPDDLARVVTPDQPRAGHHPNPRWMAFLQGRDADYPEAALQEGLQHVEQTLGRLRDSASAAEGGQTGPGPLSANPVSAQALLNQTMGASDPGGSTHGPLPLNAQVRHFDPERRRAGLPPDVAALVERVELDRITLTLVNTSALESRTVLVQMGAYGEHRATTVTAGDQTRSVEAPSFSVRLAPGGGQRLVIGVRRHVHQPTLAFPWDTGAPAVSAARPTADTQARHQPVARGETEPENQKSMR